VVQFDYSVSGSTLITNFTPAAGTLIRAAGMGNILTTGTITDDSVSTAKLQTSSVTTAKIAALSVTGDKIATGQITGNLLTANCVSGNNIVSGVALTGNVSVTGNVTTGLGTAGNPAFSFVGDTNTGIFSPAADTIAFSGGGAEAMRINSSNNLLVATATNNLLWFNDTIYGNRFLIEQNGGPANESYVTQGLVRNSNDTEAGILALGKSRGTTAGSATVVSLDDSLGTISFQGADGTNLVEAVRISAIVDGTPGANDMPGRLMFSTTADGSASPTERMRINSSGNVQLSGNLGIGGTTPTTSGTGITFPATQSASSNANTLDDYEEGTWTPTVSGWTSVTYSHRVGKYTKIGNQVTAWFYIQFSGTSAATFVEITGLPFSEFVSLTRGGALSYYDVAINETTGVLAYVNETTINFYADNDSGSIILSNGNVTNQYLIGSVTYQS